MAQPILSNSQYNIGLKIWFSRTSDFYTFLRLRFYRLAQITKKNLSNYFQRKKSARSAVCVLARARALDEERWGYRIRAPIEWVLITGTRTVGSCNSTTADIVQPRWVNRNKLDKHALYIFLRNILFVRARCLEYIWTRSLKGLNSTRMFRFALVVRFFCWVTWLTRCNSL